MRLNLKDLEETKIYYEKELEDEELTGGERDSYLKALKLIEGFIEREKRSREKIVNNLNRIGGGSYKPFTLRVRESLIYPFKIVFWAILSGCKDCLANSNKLFIISEIFPFL